MNALTTTWRQLVRHRLWPVALLLVAALAAVPVLLSRDADPVPPAPVPTAPSTSAKVSDTLATPVIDAATPEQRGRRRRVLGVRKDPFTPEAIKHPKKKKAPKKKPASTSTPDTAPSQSTGPSTSAPSSPGYTTPVAPTPPKKTYAKGSLIVRFGDATSDDLERLNLKKLAALPQDTDAEDATPLLVYTGLTKHGKKAVFLVDESLEPTGDGTCQPHPSTCETVELGKGETEFFDVIDPDTGEVTAQFELDLVDIK
jgi:hypothetical protein